MRIDIRIKNLDKLTRGLNKFPGNLKREFRVAMEKAIFMVEGKAKPITPYDTGRLRASITKDYIKSFAAAISPKVNYAIYVHMGTRYWPLSMPPKKPGTVRQFMKIGAEKAEPTIDILFNSAVEKALMESIY